MEQRTGRPPKATTEQKIAIVNQYFITSTEGDGAELRAHGIFRKLSEYAKTRNCSLEPHDFSRDDAVRRHIERLADTSLQKIRDIAGIPTYEPLDITALLMGGRESIERTLRDREAYFEMLHIRAAKAIENYAMVSQQSAQYREEATTAKKQNEELRGQIDKLTMELRNAMQDVAYLKRVIRKDVEPERAQEFLEGLKSRDDIAEKTSAAVLNTINTLAREDRQMQAEAKEEINLLDLTSLFK